MDQIKWNVYMVILLMQVIVYISFVVEALVLLLLKQSTSNTKIPHSSTYIRYHIINHNHNNQFFDMQRVDWLHSTDIFLDRCIK